MAESKNQRNARLKAMRRKYGLGEFKNKKTTTRSVISVAKRRSFRSVVRRSSKSFGSFWGIADKVAMGIGYKTLSDRYVVPMVSGTLGQYSSWVGLGVAGYRAGLEGVAGAYLLSNSSGSVATAGNGSNNLG